MKPHSSHNHDVEEAFSPTTVYTPRRMLPVLKDALVQEAEADHVELTTLPHEAHHFVSLVHRRHHRYGGSAMESQDIPEAVVPDGEYLEQVMRVAILEDELERFRALLNRFQRELDQLVAVRTERVGQAAA